MQNVVTIDIETYSPQDIAKVGAYRYAQDPAFRVLLVGYAIADGPVCVVDCTQETEEDGTAPLQGLRELLFDARYIKRAHNAAFEWWCLSEAYGLDWEERCAWLEQWECSMVQALYCGLPGGLEALGAALRQPEEASKARTGRALIRYFCRPCAPSAANGGRERNLPEHDPARWRLFVEYNRQDVAAERANDRLLACWPVPQALWQEWRADVRMNARGIAVDLELARGALACDTATRQALTHQARLLTGLDNPASPAQLKGWLAARGVPMDSLSAAAVAEALRRDDLPGDVRQALELRGQLSKTSVAKYAALQEMAGGDGRVRGVLQFYGAARTGRWAGRLLQVQNLPRTYLAHQDEVRHIIRRQDAYSLQALYGNVGDTLSQMIRTALVPAPGKVFLDADFSAIEARLLAWEAKEDWVLEVFRGDGKIYEATAARLYGVPVATIVKGRPNYAYRQRGKVATLALGYQGGVGAMRRMDSGGALAAMSDAEVDDIVSRWRRANSHIVGLWRKMQAAAVHTVRRGEATRPLPGVTLRKERGGAPFAFLTVQLPSGRKLFYADPAVGPDGRLTYSEQQTAGGWQRTETYGGKLTENLTQAIGRDCLAYALRNLRAAGYRVVFHVHDEVVIECATPDPAAELQKVVRIMQQPPPWAPGLPLAAAGWWGDFYTKD